MKVILRFIYYDIYVNKGDDLTSDTSVKEVTMKKSRYEIMNDNAIKALSDAINEEEYRRDSEYLIVIRNISEGYNVDFTRTDDGEWADEAYDQSCDIMTDCAFSNRGDKYITVLAKSYQNGAIEFIREQHLYVAPRG